MVSNIFYFLQNIWDNHDNPSHWLSYFSRWLKPPTRLVYWQLEQYGSYTNRIHRLGICRDDMVWLQHGPLRPLHSTPKKQVEIVENKKTRLLEAAKSAKQLFWDPIQDAPSMSFYASLQCSFTRTWTGLERASFPSDVLFSRRSLCEGHVVRPVESRRLGKGFFIAARRKETWFVSGPHFSFAVADTN